MTHKQWICGAMCGAAAAVLIALLPGCEETTTDVGITIAPQSATLTEAGASQVFEATSVGQGTGTVSGLFLPLEWHVSDSSLGSVVANGGSTAIYVSLGKSGQNVVSVKDQSGLKGVAVVTQSP